MKKLVDKGQIENRSSKKEMEKEMSKMLSIKEVCSEFGLSEVYVRRMILKGKLQSEKILIAKNTYKHMIAIEEVKRWRNASQGKGSRRSDGRNKFTLYATPEEIAQIQELVDEAKIESPIVRSNAKRVNMSDAK